MRTLVDYVKTLQPSRNWWIGSELMTTAVIVTGPSPSVGTRDLLVGRYGDIAAKWELLNGLELLMAAAIISGQPTFGRGYVVMPTFSLNLWLPLLCIAPLQITWNSYAELCMLFANVFSKPRTYSLGHPLYIFCVISRFRSRFTATYANVGQWIFCLIDIVKLSKHVKELFTKDVFRVVL